MTIAPDTVIMEFICQHCDDVVTGGKYRVLSEENGLVFLNMVVCRSCHDQAKELGLHAERISHVEETHSRHSQMSSAEAATAGH